MTYRRRNPKKKRRSARRRRGFSMTARRQKALARKIRLLKREGYPTKQAIAIAYRYIGEPRRKRARRRR